MIETNYTKGVDAEDYVPNEIDEVGGMIGKVAFQVIRQANAENVLGVFAKMPIENGDTIEEAIVELVESTAYDGTGAGALARSNPDLVVKYYNTWNRKTFKTTIDIPQIRKVLKTGKGATELSTKIVGVLGESDKYEKYTELKTLLTNAVATEDGGTGDVADALVKYATIEVGEDGRPQYKKVITTIKNAVSKMKFVNDECNNAEILRKTNAEDIYIIMPYELKNEIDVEELAGVFNLDKAEIGKRIIEIDATTDENGYDYIYVVDRNAILDYTRLYEMADQKNADGLFWNYFLHIERLFGISQLFDAMYIKVGKEAPSPVKTLSFDIEELVEISSPVFKIYNNASLVDTIEPDEVPFETTIDKVFNEIVLEIDAGELVNTYIAEIGGDGEQIGQLMFDSDETKAYLTLNGDSLDKDLTEVDNITINIVVGGE